MNDQEFGSKAFDNSSTDGSADVRIHQGLSVLVLQHPQEPGVSISTVPLIEKHFDSVIVRVGLSWPNISKALGSESEAKRWGVLYLGSVRREDLPKEERVVVVDHKGVPLPSRQAILGSLKGIILIDGTWSQAKTLWWRNAWLLKCPRLVLNPTRPSAYGTLRKEPRFECLSTLESLVEVLTALEGDASVRSSIEPIMHAFVASSKNERTGMRGQRGGSLRSRPRSGGRRNQYRNKGKRASKPK